MVGNHTPSSSISSAALCLGRSEIRISPMGVGAWAWGDRLFWGYGRTYTEADVRAAFQATVAAGINLFDTAELYGFGRAEEVLGRLLREMEGPRPVVTTKFFPYPWRVRRADLLRALRRSLARLGLAAADLYLVHQPFPPVPIETWAEGLVEAIEAGLARTVGVSNYSLTQMDRAGVVLSRHGVWLSSNQIEFHLLHRAPEQNGLLAACREMGITPVAYSPLSQGLLTGQYTPDNPPAGLMRKRYTRAILARVQPLIATMREIGRAHGDKTPAQVAINWVMCKGAVPIPGAKNLQQAKENAGALGWRLTDDEVAVLDDASDRATGTRNRAAQP